MRLLYGSQNFGYELANSDEDWLEFVYPTWKQLIDGSMMNKEKKNDDGSVTKVKDIRLIPKMIKKANFNDLQFLYSQVRVNCDDLNWFFENRDKLVRYNMWQLYSSNVGYIKAQLRLNTTKSVIRAYAFTVYLIQALQTKEFVLQHKFFGHLRQNLTENEKEVVKNLILAKLPSLEKEYVKYKNYVDVKTEAEMYEVIQAILTNRL